jgi:hypothetical protein
MHIGDRKEREEYMVDDLERQMEDQREQIRRTLDRIEGSGRRGGALDGLRGSLPRFPGRAPARGDPEETREEAPQSPESPGPTRSTPTDANEGPQSGPEERSWWRRMFGG